MIVDKIEKFLNQRGSKNIKDALLEEFLSACEDGLLRQFYIEREEKHKLYLSGIGKCLRAQAYNLQGYKKCRPITPRLKTTFFFGDLIEAMVVVLAKSAGVEIYDEQKRVKLVNVSGKIDGKLDVGDRTYIVEIKSMSDASFKNFKRLGYIDNKFGYVSQANSYAYADGGCDGWIHLGVNKNTGHMFESIHEKDEELFHKTVYDISRLNDCIHPEEFDRIEPIEETYYKKPTGNYKLDFVCAYCDYNLTCFGDKITEVIVKGKPVFYVGPITETKQNKDGVVVNHG